MPNPDSWRSAAPAYPWQQVYKAAVLERDPAKLEEFVQSAFTVIYEHRVLAATRRKKVKRY